MAFLSEAAVELALLDQLRGLGYSIEREEGIATLAQIRNSLLLKLIFGALCAKDVNSFLKARSL